MAKLLGTSPGFWHPTLQTSNMNGGTIEPTTGSTIFAYYDAGGLIPRSDPVVLGRDGVAITYYSGDALYSYSISNSSGTQVQTAAAVGPIPHPYSIDSNLDTNGNSIVSASNGDITITSDGRGRILLDGQKFPDSDGTSGFLMTTDGAGVLSMGRAAYALEFQTAPQLGGNLDANTYNITFDTGAGFSDANDNEQLLFTRTTSAVNYVNIANSITTNGPTITAAGDDDNIDLNLEGKGSKGVQINSVRYPISDGLTGSFPATDGSGALTCTVIDTSLSYATQAEVFAATSTTDVLTAENIKYHPGQVAAYALSDSTLSGTTPETSFNINSHSATTESAASAVTITFNLNRAMANSDYCVIVTGFETSSIYDGTFTVSNRTLTSFEITGQDMGNTVSTRSLSVIVFGELA